MPVLERSELEASPLADLHAIADQLGLDGYRRLRKAELIDAILAGPGAGAEQAGTPAPQKGGERDGRSARAQQPRPRARARGAAAGEGGARTADGVVELLDNGSAFLRVDPPEPSDEDVYISAAQVRRCELVSGDRVSGSVRTPRRSERAPNASAETFKSACTFKERTEIDARASSDRAAASCAACSAGCGADSASRRSRA